jgi:DNA-binding NarL/FixJ family response regulator
MKLNVELSRRETEVAHLLAWGASKKEVATFYLFLPAP